MDDFFPFIYIHEKEPEFEQVSLYIEDIIIESTKIEIKEEERVAIIEIL